VAMDDHGNAVVVWQQYDGCSHLSLYAKRLTSGSWGAVTLLEYGTGDAWSPQVAMDDHGNALVVWTQYDSSSHLNLYAKRFSAGSWGAVTLMEYGAGGVWGPQVAMDNSGNAVVVWSQLDSSSHMSLYARYFSSGTWGAVTLLKTEAGDASSPSVAMDDNGNAMAVWKQTENTMNGYHDHVYAKRFSSGAWEATISIGYDVGVFGPQVAMDDNGNAMAVWSDFYGSAAGGQYISANRYSAGAWGKDAHISTEWLSVSPQIVMDNQGNAMVVFEGIDYNTQVAHIYADRFTTGAWGTETLLQTGMGNAANPEIAMAGNGHAVAVWQAGDGSRSSIYASIYDAGA
jgi:hypothetical protein